MTLFLLAQYIPRLLWRWLCRAWRSLRDWQVLP
jgi:hypothetical protein